MGRNKDSLIELAAKLTGENCGEVKTKKDALKKIACFYAGQDVECNTVADALQCIAEHCSGGSGGVSGCKVTLYYHSIPESTLRLYLTQDPVMNIGKEQTLLTIDGGGNITEDIVTITDAGEGYTVITRASGNSVTLSRTSSGDITFDCGESSEVGSNESVKTHYMAFSLSENTSSSTNKANWKVKAINPYFSNFILLNSLTDEELTGKSVFILANKELNKGDIITTDEIECILFLNSDSSVYEFMLSSNETVTAREINLVSAKIKDLASDTYEADCSEVLNLVITD